MTNNDRATPPRRIRALVLAMVAALMLSGCLTGTPDATAPSSADPSLYQGVPAELLPFYRQAVQWQPCEKTSMRCATVEVPMDYSAPGLDRISLSVVKLPASGERRGSLLVNPGGPGGSGYDLIANSSSQMFSADLRQAYDLVGFDPRGVKRSQPVTCFNDAERDRMRQEEYDLETDAGFAAGREQAQRLASACQQNTGPVLGFVDTNSAARDLDVLRAITGSPALNYLGFSYGTYLGARYAELFPDKVGRFVLDGAMDPALSIEQLVLGQAKGFEAAFRNWTENCLRSSDCPLGGTVEEAMQQARDLNDSYVANAKATSDGRLLTASDFNSALTVSLYSTELWDVLKKALAQAFSGNPEGMMSLADYAMDRDPQTGKYTSNSIFALTAINCLDYPMSAEQEAMRLESLQLQQASPTFGKYLGYSGLLCGVWPHQASTERAAITAEGAGPIVVIGTTGDPATPYEWSVALRHQLSSAVLVTWEGEGHTAYGKDNECIRQAVDSYFIDGTVPKDRMRCR